MRGKTRSTGRPLGRRRFLGMLTALGAAWMVTPGSGRSAGDGRLSDREAAFYRPHEPAR